MSSEPRQAHESHLRVLAGGQLGAVQSKPTYCQIEYELLQFIGRIRYSRDFGIVEFRLFVKYSFRAFRRFMLRDKAERLIFFAHNFKLLIGNNRPSFRLKKAKILRFPILANYMIRRLSPTGHTPNLAIRLSVDVLLF